MSRRAARGIPLLALALACLAGAAEPPQPAHDGFHHLAEINQASLVMLVETGLVPAELAATIADGVARVIAENDVPGASRSSDYLVFEERLLEIAGAEASRLHTGRSRQDIGSTSRRLALREALLATYEAQLAPRAALLELAAAHPQVVVPAYTHGVQAQPTSLAHVLLAFAAALERDGEQLQQVWSRLNRCPLGAAALATSGFALDRARLAELLGFDGVVENSYDANLVSSVDSKLELAGALAISAIGVGQFVQNLHIQYHDPRPWLLLAPAQTSGSSIMPQKRNPRPLDQLRTRANAVVGGAQAALLNAHNTSSGMHDYRDATTLLATSAEAREMYRRYAEIVAGLAVDAERALEELDAGYSTMTEVADVLLREAEVPFRIGHHYASSLTAYGRAQGKRPRELTVEELARIYREAVGEELPLPPERIQAAFDPRRMVAGRRGLGGPQPAEIQRMLAGHRRRLAAARGWLADTRHRIAEAAARRDAAFAALRPPT